MNRTWGKWTLAAGLLFATGCESKHEETVNGTWQLTEQTINGKRIASGALSQERLVLNGGVASQRHKNQEVRRGMLWFDPSTRTIDITWPDEKGEHNTLQGIYKREGNRLTICFGGYGKDRATEFTAAAGSGRSLIVAKLVQE